MPKYYISGLDWGKEIIGKKWLQLTYLFSNILPRNIHKLFWISVYLLNKCQQISCRLGCQIGGLRDRCVMCRPRPIQLCEGKNITKHHSCEFDTRVLYELLQSLCLRNQTHFFIRHVPSFIIDNHCVRLIELIIQPKMVWLTRFIFGKKLTL